MRYLLISIFPEVQRIALMLHFQIMIPARFSEVRPLHSDVHFRDCHRLFSLRFCVRLRRRHFRFGKLLRLIKLLAFQIEFRVLILRRLLLL